MTSLLATLLVIAAVAEDPTPPRVTGSGVSASQTRQLADFDEIEFRIAGDFRVTIGEPTPLKIEADENILELIKTEVIEGRLIVSSEKPYQAKHEPDLSITIPRLNGVQVLGSGDLTIRGLDNEKFQIAVHGSADVRVSGRTDTLNVAVNGSGDVFAYELTARHTSVAVKGSGDVRVNATESLNVAIQGSGDVSYTGHPQVQQAISGSGDVRQAKEKPAEEKAPEAAAPGTGI